MLGALRAVRRFGAALHPALVLAAIVLAAFLLPLPVLLKVPDWAVMTDELLYTKLAVAAGDNLSPAPRLHGEYYPLLSQLYPVLLSPIVGLFDMPTAFKAAHVLNSLLMASTAIPAYLLARSAALPRAAAYGVAALTVTTPWVLLGVVIWTDSIAYPAFAWALLAMHRATTSPGARNDVLALCGLALAFYARTQFALLAIVLPAVLVLHHLGFALVERQGSRPLAAAGHAMRLLLRSHRVLIGAYALAGLAAFVMLRSGGRSHLLGAYSTTADGDLLPAGVVHLAEQQLAAVAVGIGVVPLLLALGWAVPTLIRPLGRERHALAVLGFVVVPALLLQASSFTLRFSSNVHHDRYVFFLAPLLFAGMVACLVEGRRRWPFVLAAGLALAHVVGTLTYEPGSAPPYFASPPGVFWPVWDGRAYELGRMLGIADLSPRTAFRWGSVIAAAGLAAALLWLPRRVVVPAVILGLLVFCVGETRWVLTHAWFDTTAPAPDLSAKDWVDDALPDGAEAGLVPVFVGNSTFEAQRVWWFAEFWNKNVTQMFQSNGADTYTPFHAETMTVDPERGTVESSDVMDYLVVARVDLRFRLAGSAVGDFGALQLIRPLQPYRAAWATRNLGVDGWTIAGSVPSVRLFAAPGVGAGRRVSVRLWAPPEVLSRRGYTLSDGRRRTSGVVELGEEVTATLVTCVPPQGTTDVRFDVRGSNVTADGRRVGLRVIEIDVQLAAERGCRR